jgi:hypothetical protein
MLGGFFYIKLGRFTALMYPHVCVLRLHLVYVHLSLFQSYTVVEFGGLSQFFKKV